MGFNDKALKGRDIKDTGTPFKIAKLDALETANHMAASEIDIGFGATSALTQAIM